MSPFSHLQQFSFANAENTPDRGNVTSPDSLNCETILLAAGRSRRMGGVNKLLLPVAGMAMLRRTAQLYLDLGMALTVVTGSENCDIAAVLTGLDLRIVINPAADSGQQTSVQAGLTASPLVAPGVMIALADQPLLDLTDLRALMTAFSSHGGTRICVPRFAGTRGNPVIFPVALARHLRDTCQSPRAFIDAHPLHVAWFEATNDHFTRDVDTPGDAAQLLGITVAAPPPGLG